MPADQEWIWGGGESYETFMGRWSRPLAREFVRWLDIPAYGRWVDVGCGTGGLTQTVLDLAAPRAICAVEPAEGFLDHARERIRDERVRFERGDACNLPLEAETCDVVASGLMLNFVPDPAAALEEMRRVTRPGGTVAAYVWDYADRMEFLRLFWDAAIACDPAAVARDEGRLFPLCHPERLRELFEAAGLQDVGASPLDVTTHFESFEDYWTPFLGKQGPAPGYVASLGDEARDTLREHLRATLPAEPDGSIKLIARAWAVRGKRTGS